MVLQRRVYLRISVENPKMVVKLASSTYITLPADLYVVTVIYFDRKWNKVQYCRSAPNRRNK